ncbi:hypothetical protein B0T14DRAFT_579702 [Immersiella caudata]|uniref:Uncharacterized protein n=1 Tax=Immersiella caudata TaxID=314043 RepID=A0AA40C6P0_9PEZI|nr:hypothetical protein B0T14DRAFT_579702 [Immersiella caudata]
MSNSLTMFEDDTTNAAPLPDPEPYLHDLLSSGSLTARTEGFVLYLLASSQQHNGKISEKHRQALEEMREEDVEYEEALKRMEEWQREVFDERHKGHLKEYGSRRRGRPMGLEGKGVVEEEEAIGAASTADAVAEEYDLTRDNVQEFFMTSSWTAIKACLDRECEKWRLLCPEPGVALAAAPVPAAAAPMHDFLRRLVTLTLEGDVESLKRTLGMIDEERPSIEKLQEEKEYADLALRFAEDAVYLNKVPKSCGSESRVLFLKARVAATAKQFFHVFTISEKTWRLRHYVKLPGD